MKKPTIFAVIVVVFCVVFGWLKNLDQRITNLEQPPQLPIHYKQAIPAEGIGLTQEHVLRIEAAARALDQKSLTDKEGQYTLPTAGDLEKWAPPEKLTEEEFVAELAAAGKRIAKRGEAFTLKDGTPLLYNDATVTYSGRHSQSDFAQIMFTEILRGSVRPSSPIRKTDTVWVGDMPISSSRQFGTTRLLFDHATPHHCVYRTVENIIENER